MEDSESGPEVSSNAAGRPRWARSLPNRSFAGERAESYIFPDEVGAYGRLGASELAKRRFDGRVDPSCYFANGSASYRDFPWYFPYLDQKFRGYFEVVSSVVLQV